MVGSLKMCVVSDTGVFEAPWAAALRNGVWRLHTVGQDLLFALAACDRSRASARAVVFRAEATCHGVC
jgi:hypothetical protein